MERTEPEHETPLITTIAAGLVFAFGFGLAANRPLIGYLLAGILAGPFTSSFGADQALANPRSASSCCSSPSACTSRSPILCPSRRLSCRVQSAG